MFESQEGTWKEKTTRGMKEEVEEEEDGVIGGDSSTGFVQGEEAILRDTKRSTNTNSNDNESPDGDNFCITPLHTAWDVDRHIVLDSADKVVLVRFSSYGSPPDEVVFPSLPGRPSNDPIHSNEEEEEGEEDGIEGGKKRDVHKKDSSRKHRLHHHHHRKKENDNDDDDDLLDALKEMEERKSPQRKKTKIEEATVRDTRRKTRSAAGGDTSLLTTTTTSSALQGKEVIAGMEHYLATQKIDSLLSELAPKVRKFCKIFSVDTSKVPEFNGLYELGHDRDPFALMFFYRNTHIKIDVGTGNTNKINFFAFEDWSDLLPMVEAAYRAGKMGKNMTSVERKYSTVALRR